MRTPSLFPGFWFTPCDARFEIELQSALMLARGAAARKFIQYLTDLGIEGGDGHRSHMGAREAALRMAARQVFVDSRSPGRRPEALLTSHVEQITRDEF